MCRRFFEIYKGACMGFLVFLSACTTVKENENRTGFDKISQHFQVNIRLCIQYLDSMDQENTTGLQKNFLKARDSFKKIEPILAFIDNENYSALNAPNILKVEEESVTDVKVREPLGMQVLEELVFSDSIDRESVLKTVRKTSARLRLLAGNTDLSYYQDYHFLWMIRNAFLRVALMGITGFDSPVLERSLEEARIVYGVLKEYMNCYESSFTDPRLAKEWDDEFNASCSDLESQFGSFDRYTFLKKHTHHQMTLWRRTAADWKVHFPFEVAIRNDASTLFGRETFNNLFFADKKDGAAHSGKIELGKKLFNDRNLSHDGNMSCATCHMKELAFTDGKIKSRGQARNSPTLTYAGLQQQFFYDNRTGSLEGQVLSVVNNITEFHTDVLAVSNAVKQNPLYKKGFDGLYKEGITDRNIRNAIATYVRGLSDFDSRFDRSIRGEETSLTESEILGFNLFMGKAKCATCHFAPVFNGTVPPDFNETELEMLGVPSSTDTVQAQIDPDFGRYELFNTTQRKYFFKTPTVRNIALTAPYMHNGVFQSLEQVIDFYDRGGGAGLGINEPYQTLPSERLNLSKLEKQALIDFLKSLTDQTYAK